jgi:light-regulated signal transduction histidine kinase (bacteriophytochrome)
MELHAVNLTELLQDTRPNLPQRGFAARQSNASWIWNEIPFAMTDEDRVERLFGYPDRQCDALHAGSGSITIAQQPTTGDRISGHGRRDTGCGIAPDDLPHVFERFFRQIVRGKRAEPGLGLSIESRLSINLAKASMLKAIPAREPVSTLH